MVFPQIGLLQLRPSIDEFLLGWGTVGDIADGGVLVGVVMRSHWVWKGFIVAPMKLLYDIINIINHQRKNTGINE